MKELLKKRKGFNFYRSYYDVFNLLSEKDRLDFITAILDKQFEGRDTDLEGMALLAYTSQKHSIDSQVEGFLNKMRGSQPPSLPPTEPPSYVSNDSVMTTEPPSVPPSEPPYQQEKEEEKEEEKEQVKLTKEQVKLTNVRIRFSDTLDELLNLPDDF
jgi:hypothetical protein